MGVKRTIISSRYSGAILTSVKSGVPQGSVLAPLLFIIVTNDLPQTISNSNSHILTFADDTKVSSKVSSVNDVKVLQNNMNSITQWLASNNMKLNSNKFELISHKLFPDSNNLTLLKELLFLTPLLTIMFPKTKLSPVLNMYEISEYS